MTSFDINDPDTPIVAAAIHDGHALREEISSLCALDEAKRLREEDPFTGRWTDIVGNRIIVGTSRFEADINRAREKAVYLEPEDAWGLTVWKQRPDPAVINRSLAGYDDFYNRLYEIFSGFQQRFGKFFVFDLHSYNYRREGPNGPPADPEGNPEVNIGTGTMNRTRWTHLVDRFMSDLRAFDYLGRRLDVRENIKFYGRQFAQWTHQTFPQSACVISADFKKFFMDEWTGQPDNKHVNAIREALRSTLPGILEELNK